MNTRKFAIDKNELIEQGRSIIKISRDTKYIYRVTLVNLILAGVDPEVIAFGSDVTTRTLSNWVKDVAERGFDALQITPQPGRPSKLTDENKEEIKDALVKDPQESGYNVWDGPSLSDFISKKFSVDYSVRASQRLMHELGFALIRPQAFPSKGAENTPKREEFKKN